MSLDSNAIGQTRGPVRSPAVPAPRHATAPRSQSPRLRSIDSFALVQGPKGCGLVVDDLKVGTPMGAWLESDAIVVAGQAGMVRICIGQQIRNAHWPDKADSKMKISKVLTDRSVPVSASCIDLMEVVCWPTQTGTSGLDSHPPAQRRLWRLPLLEATSVQA